MWKTNQVKELERSKIDTGDKMLVAFMTIKYNF